MGIFPASGHTGEMGRTVTAVVTHDGACAGMVGPFPVEIPWWAEVEPVVAHLERTLGVPVVILRLLTVEGSDGARDGHVTYHAEALEPPGRATPAATSPTTTTRSGCPGPARRACGSSSSGRPRQVDLTGRPVQRKTWNLSGLFRLPTADGPVWLKAIPAFAAAEAAAIAAFAEVDPDLVPAVLASGPGRLLLATCPGADCWDAVPAGRGGRRGPPGRRAGPHRPAAAGHPRPPSGGAGGGRRATCSTARSAPSCSPDELERRAEPAAAVGDAGRLRPARHRRARRLPPRQLALRRRRARSSSTSPTRTWATPCSTGCARSTSCRAGRRRAAAERLDRGLDRRRATLPSGRGAADRRAAGAPRLRRPVPGVPRQHRAQRARLPPRRPGRVDPRGARLAPATR